MQRIFGFFGLLYKLYIALVFFFFGLLFYPLFFTLQLRPAWKKAGFKVFIAWSWMMRICCFYPVRFRLKSPLPEGPYVIIANHTSYLDIFLLHSILPQQPFAFLGKAEILKYPIVRTYFKALNIPVYRKDKSKAGQALVQAGKAIEDGWSIVIFPEGTIPDHQCPEMLPFKDGAFRLAKRFELPIVALTFTSSYHLFSDPTEILGPAHPGFVDVYLHPYVSPVQVREMELNELRQFCFDLVNGPILQTHPHLQKKINFTP
jgi:1-acyl-sn-glycerol-3-phosphate acyltransferase